MKSIKIRIEDLSPRENKNSILDDQFNWRKTGTFTGESIVSIVNPVEPVWWNRPLDSDVLIKVEDDGLYSYNVPFAYRDVDRQSYKSGYNLLLGKFSLCIAIQISFDEGWSETQKEKLSRMSYSLLGESLLELGVEENHLSVVRNDFLYDKKKFAGLERKITDDLFYEAYVITLEYLPEKEIFDRLTGKYAHTRLITGIQEEDPRVTREALTNKLFEKYTAFFESL